MRVEPFLTAFLILLAMTGCPSVVLEPVTKMHLAPLISSMVLVIAPLPKTAARPATEGACQRRAQ